MRFFFNKSYIFAFFITIVLSCSKDSELSVNSAPESFNITFSEVTLSEITLSWDMAIDPDGDTVTYSITLNNNQVVGSLSSLSYSINNLTPNTLYNGKVIAQDSKGNTTDSNFIFTTKSVPELITYEIEDLSLFSVDIGGKLINTGSSEVLEVGIVVNTQSSPTLEININQFEIEPTEDDEIFTTITNIPAGLTYYLRTYAINEDGIGYGNEVQFTAFEEKVHEGTVSLKTQEEVESFGAFNYTTINGSLEISESVNDLSPLNSLIIINGGFDLRYTDALVNFSGLENLEVIGAISGQTIRIEFNSSLENFVGLNSLKYTRGGVQIVNNNVLKNFHGLENYTASYAGGFGVWSCDELESFEGLENLAIVGDWLLISGNSKLNNLTALSNLTYVHRRIVIKSNYSLENLNGFEGITEIVGLEIVDNNVLTNLDGFTNLNSVDEIIRIKQNQSLNDLSVFQNIKSLEYLAIENNSSLTNLDGFEQLTTIYNSISITNNTLLNDYCGLLPIFSLPFLPVMTISGNLVNPSAEEIINNCD